tara:strand:- start:10203 stop:10376 length:174 start_codon:yes stop_codon:yes gene_type:complete
MTISPHYITSIALNTAPSKKKSNNTMVKLKCPSSRTMRRAEEKKDNRIKGKLKLNLH